MWSDRALPHHLHDLNVHRRTHKITPLDLISSHLNTVNTFIKINFNIIVPQCWATGWTIGVLGFYSRRWLGMFLFTTASRTALGPTQPPIHWVPGALSLVVKRPGREADHSPPSSAEVEEWVEIYLHSPNTPSWSDAQLKHRDNFTFTFLTDWRNPPEPPGGVALLRAWIRDTISLIQCRRANHLTAMDVGGRKWSWRDSEKR
jgi:hypothetical protein